jgi:hypothetical protein
MHAATARIALSPLLLLLLRFLFVLFLLLPHGCAGAAGRAGRQRAAAARRLVGGKRVLAGLLGILLRGVGLQNKTGHRG